MSKAQVSNEFLIFVTLLFLISILVFSLSSSLIFQANEVKTYEEAKKICDDIAYEINLALKVGDGYEREFFVPYEINGIADFMIKIENYSVSLEWKEYSVQSPLPIEKINGEIKKGWNIIRNVEGEIYAN